MAAAAEVVGADDVDRKVAFASHGHFDQVGSWRRYTPRSRPEWPGLVDESLGVAFLVAEALELVGAEGDQRGFVVGEQLHFLADGISVETQAGFGEVLHACWNMRSLLMPLRRSSAMTT